MQVLLLNKDWRSFIDLFRKIQSKRNGDKLVHLLEHGFAQTCYSVHIAGIEMSTSDTFSKVNLMH